MDGAVFEIMGSIVGAGFASGREIMHFFSRFGGFSWLLAFLAGACIGFLSYWIMRWEQRKAWYCRLPLFFLWIASAASMTAAAGELLALTVPIPGVRIPGGFLTLAFCLPAVKKEGSMMRPFSKVLLPLLILAFLLALKTDGPGSSKASSALEPMSLPGVLSYSGMNAMLSSAIIQEKGKDRNQKGKKTLAFSTGLLCVFLLFLGNAALLPHLDALIDAPLPMVVLLRNYGKTGFYLSALTLYFAVATTLMAALRSLRRSFLDLHWAWGFPLSLGAAALLSLGGFQTLVAVLYPLLGWISLILFFLPAFLSGALKNHFFSTCRKNRSSLFNSI